MGEFNRVLVRDNVDPPIDAILADWLDDKELERQTLIMRLRFIDRVLVKYGRLQTPTLPQRAK